MAEPSSRAEGGGGEAPGNGKSAGAEEAGRSPGNGNSAEAGGAAADVGGSVLGLVASVVVLAVTAVASLVAKLWNAITEDGILAAAGRQGADELGAALKAFPDAIQVQESGTVWNPTQGEIAAARSGSHARGRGHTSYYSSYSRPDGPRESWPSEIAREHRSGDPGQDHGHDNGHEAGHSL